MAIPLRNVRVPDDLWKAAMKKAEAEGRTVTYVINTALRNYIAQPPQILNVSGAEAAATVDAAVDPPDSGT
ncbi:CopG family transcriptional regulator [Streptomyces sp. WAC 01529]|uniref:CopG family transcriptional regulator n=1 Tax=Streptomyces sp. WAC 01529 TaxID=2203205 RepID=UPI000F74884F|nr:CopG family transcriptional regulator [Streptomyces sp. WAC 01529]